MAGNVQVMIPTNPYYLQGYAPRSPVQPEPENPGGLFRF